MILNRQRLLGIFSVLSTANGNKVMQVADCVQFRMNRENDRLLISSTDFNAFITIDYGDMTGIDSSDIPDQFLVNFRIMNAILKTSTTDTVRIAKRTDGKKIIIETNGTYELTRWDADDEFPLTNFAYTEVGKWPVPLIQSAWNKVVIAISQDVTKIAYQGVNYDGNFAASDNRRLSVVKGELEYSGQPVLLMPSFGDILKHCKNEVSVGLSENGKMFIIVCSEIGLIASVRTIDAKFIDYKPFMLVSIDGAQVIVSKQDIIGALSRLMIFTDQLFKVVSIKSIKNDLDGISLAMSIDNRNAGVEIIQVLNHDDIGDGFNFRYHIDNLMDGISVTDNTDEVAMTIQRDGKLWIQEKDFRYVLTKVTE